jgi:hypothetical protein
MWGAANRLFRESSSILAQLQSDTRCQLNHRRFSRVPKMVNGRAPLLKRIDHGNYHELTCTQKVVSTFVQGVRCMDRQTGRRHEVGRSKLRHRVEVAFGALGFVLFFSSMAYLAFANVGP